ncbi:hypothetical protein N9L18_00345 [Candidatus Pacebacteria bacterium]|nr:hypothetical protein [Candidatus Paceibacterota bacterium]
MKPFLNICLFALIISFTTNVALANDYGDVRFFSPTEGQSRAEEVGAGQYYNIEWENIIGGESGWQISLHEYDGNPSNSDISNGPSDYAGARITVLGNVSSNQDELSVVLPNSLKEGYYYFNFGGKAAYDNSPLIKIKDSGNGDRELALRVSPDVVTHSEEIQIRFNDISADYYVLSASCKDSVSVGGKARPDLCFEGEKIYPTGKDVILVKDFYPRTNTGNRSIFHLEVTAYDNGIAVDNDSESVDIKSAFQSTNISNPTTTSGNTGQANLSSDEKLDLVESVFGRDSDVYQIIQLMIVLGVI